MAFKGLNRFEALSLFIGDVAILYFSLWLTLVIRSGSWISSDEWMHHVYPFTLLFVVWLMVYFIAGLYEKHTSVLQKRLPGIIFNAQLANSVIGIGFFYFAPFFGITPKTTLFLSLVVSCTLIVLWRRFGMRFVVERTQAPAILIGSGDEMRDLIREVNETKRHGLSFVSTVDLDHVDAIDFQKEVIERIYVEGIMTIVIDTKNDKVLPILPALYHLIFSGVRFIDMHKVYEDIFDRVPLSLVQYGWFLENISVTRKFTYEFLKRVMDIMIALPLFLVSLLLYPFVALAIWLEDGGNVFITQDRVGRNNKLVKIYKVRTMMGCDTGDEVLKSEQRVTRAGAFFRKSRIDELPQLWNVLRGDLSLIGPRPELPALVKCYEEEVPFYNVRHLIKPGLSGWGQINDYDVPRKGVDVEKTRRKLAYDLYYITNRSFFLDLKIALKTLKTLMSRVGV